MTRSRAGIFLALALPLVLALAGGWAAKRAILERWEERSIDWRFVLRGPVAADPEPLVVAVDDRTFAELGLQHPLPPRIYADLVRKLRAAGAAVVAVDFLRAEPSRECDPPDQDALLGAALAEGGGDVVWAGHFDGHDRFVPPIPTIASAAGAVGFVNFPDSLNGSIRQFLPERDGHPAFATAALELYAGVRPPSIAGGALRRIDFRGSAGRFETVSMSTVLAGGYPPERIAGRICLVGATAAGSQDRHRTPFADTTHPDVPGIEIHANVIGNALRNDFLAAGGSRLAWGVVVVLGLLIAAAFLLGRPLLASLVWIGGSAGFGAWALARFTHHEVVPLVAPLLVVGAVFWTETLVVYVAERRRRREIRALFASYVDPKVVDWLEHKPDAFDPAGERRVVTVLDTDIQGFTTITESTTPTELVAQLNRYFDEIGGAAIAAGGMIDKYVGDALMVVFGFPMEQADHAHRALVAAEEIQKRVRALNREWHERGLPELVTRIGICSGEVVMGAVGGRARKSITAMGDAANVASRLEGLNKRLGTRVLLSESTAQLLPPEVELRDLGEVQVRGLRQPIEVFSPGWDVPPELPPELLPREEPG